MDNERPHPSAFAVQRLLADDVRLEAEARTAQINGLKIGYRIAAPKKSCVLVVDDDHDNADSLAMLIKFWGHQVWTAYDGPAGLETAAVHSPDVVCLDIGMPVISGCDLARQLRGQTRFEKTFLIAITGYADAKHRELCVEAGFDAVLVKPVELSALELLLARLEVGAPSNLQR